MMKYRKTGAVLSVLILALSLYGCGNEKSNVTDGGGADNQSISSQNDSQSNEKQAEQEAKAKEIKSLEDKYRPILEANKKYESMTNEEGKLAVSLIKDWPKLTTEYKNKYSSAKNAIETSKKDYDSKKKAEEDAKKEAEKIASYNTGITYEQLARTPDDYKGKKVKFSGTAIQVLQDNNETAIRLAVDGDYSKIIFAAYKTDISNVRILENDHVIIRGTSGGIINYQSAFGVPISIPGVLVDKIELNN